MAQTNNEAGDRFKLTGHISRPLVEVGTRHIHTNYQEAFEFDIGQFGPSEIELVLHDSELISSLLRNNPAEMTEIINNVLTGHTEAAVRLASQIGLTEEAFHQRGGGPFFWVAIALCAGAIFAAAATTKPAPKQK
jgi:hypothetical protein